MNATNYIILGCVRRSFASTRAISYTLDVDTLWLSFLSVLFSSVACIQRRRKFLYFVFSSSCFSPFFIFSPMRCVNHFMHSHFFFCVWVFGSRASYLNVNECHFVFYCLAQANVRRQRCCGVSVEHVLRSAKAVVCKFFSVLWTLLFICVHYFSTYFTQRDTCNISIVPLTRAPVYDSRSATKSLGCTERDRSYGHGANFLFHDVRRWNGLRRKLKQTMR